MPPYTMTTTQLANRTCPENLNATFRAPITWLFPTEATDNQELETWCRTLGPPVIDSIPVASFGALSARNGVGLMKLMGRHSGFIAAFATLAHSEVNFCLVPEVPFTMNGFLHALEKRLRQRDHAVIVVAEGAGQDLLTATAERDASGNVRLADIGLFLKEKIKDHCAEAGFKISLKYIDPSYTIRSMPANAYDSAFCLMLAHNAVHAGMAGKTNLVIGDWRRELVHVPIAAAVGERKLIDPDGPLWNAVVSATGQPAEMG